MNSCKSTAENSLPIVADCEGCGVCCFHMGYPAYILPRAPMTDAEIDADPELVQKIKIDSMRRAELLAGNPGESYWHSLPADLKVEWEAFVASYKPPVYGDAPSTFDGPCFWLDMETRRCKNHEHRPRICRNFETGSSECLEWRSYYSDKISSKPQDAN